MLSLRGRLGLVNGPFLVYTTAGVAGGYGSFDVLTDVGPGTVTTANAAGIVYGPTAGVGAEYAVNDKVSLTAEGAVTSLSPLTTTGDKGKGSYTATGRTNDFNVRSGVKFPFFERAGPQGGALIRTAPPAGSPHLIRPSALFA